MIVLILIRHSRLEVNSVAFTDSLNLRDGWEKKKIQRHIHILTMKNNGNVLKNITLIFLPIS